MKDFAVDETRDDQVTDKRGREEGMEALGFRLWGSRGSGFGCRILGLGEAVSGMFFAFVWDAMGRKNQKSSHIHVITHTFEYLDCEGDAEAVVAEHDPDDRCGVRRGGCLRALCDFRLEGVIFAVVDEPYEKPFE